MILEILNFHQRISNIDFINTSSGKTILLYILIIMNSVVGVQGRLGY